MKYINIKGTKYKYIETNKLEGDVVAMCDKQNKIIYQHPDRTEEEKKKNLIHETVHGILCEVGADQTIPSALEEVICESISTTFYDLFLRQKPKRKTSKQQINEQ